MLANIKPGKPARPVSAIATPALMALIEAKRRGPPLEGVMPKIMQAIEFDGLMYEMSSTPHCTPGQSVVRTDNVAPGIGAAILREGMR
jgi:hypothetical protein